MNTENMNQNQNTDLSVNQGAGEKTFTQDDVNRIVQDRLAKDREKASKDRYVLPKSTANLHLFVLFHRKYSLQDRLSYTAHFRPYLPCMT